MKSGLPEDLLLHPSGRSGLRPLGLQRDRSPGGSCSPLFSCAAEITKPHGAQGKARTSVGTAFPWAGSRAVWPCSGRGQHCPSLPPAPWVRPGRGAAPQLLGRVPQLSEELLQGPFPHPVWLGAVLRSRGCVRGGQGDALALKSHRTCVLHGPGCHMNVFANVGS